MIAPVLLLGAVTPAHAETSFAECSAKLPAAQAASAKTAERISKAVQSLETEGLYDGLNTLTRVRAEYCIAWKKAYPNGQRVDSRVARSSLLQLEAAAARFLVGAGVTVQFNLTGRATSSNWVPFTGDAAFDRAEYCYTPGRDYEGLNGL